MSPCARVGPRAFVRGVASQRGCVATSPALEPRSGSLDRASGLAFANSTIGLHVRGNRTHRAAPDAVFTLRAREMRRRPLRFQGDTQPSNDDTTARAIANSSMSASYGARAKTKQNCACTSAGECHNGVSALAPRRGYLDGVERCARAAQDARLAALHAPRQWSTSGTAMRGTAPPTRELPPHIIGCHSRAHQGGAVGRSAYGMSLVTDRQDGLLGLAPPPSPALSLRHEDGVLKFTRRSSSTVLSLHVPTPVNISAVIPPLMRSTRRVLPLGIRCGTTNVMGGTARPNIKHDAVRKSH